MTKKVLSTMAIAFLLCACQPEKQSDSLSEKVEDITWTYEDLSNRALQQLDSAKWDTQLFQQDIETYHKYNEIFQSYPLNKSPFPVAEYDYAVSSIPFTIETEEAVFKGVRIGEYESPESEAIIDKLTLLVLSNEAESGENTLVDSRNYPYLTAQGIFEVKNNEIDWVFVASPDGFSTLILNMKLFDLRFGETIIIYPQIDQSFLYDQLNESPNNYEDFEEFKKVVLNSPKVKHQLKSAKNVN